MREAVLIQWARLGDLLQTRVLLRRLQEVRPEVRRVLCTDARYTDVIQSFPETFDYWPVDLRKWTALSRHSASHDELLRTLAQGRSCISEVEEPETYVLTKSLAAVVFAERLRPSRQNGYIRRGKDLVSPPAIENVEAALLHGTSVSVHLSDLWASLAGEQRQSDWLPPLKNAHAGDRQAHSDIPRIGVFCDAGESHRCIPRAWLAELVAELIRMPGKVTLLGAQASEERDELSGLSATFPSSVQDRRGKTAMADLSRTLIEQHSIIGPDTGGLHLAAALGVPVVGLYFGGARCVHTGPYSPNAAVIENPAWDSEHVQAVVSLVCKTVSASMKEHSASIPVMRPVLDRFGLVYGPERNIAETIRTTERYRSDFFSHNRLDGVITDSMTAGDQSRVSVRLWNNSGENAESPLSEEQ